MKCPCCGVALVEDGRKSVGVLSCPENCGEWRPRASSQASPECRPVRVRQRQVVAGLNAAGDGVARGMLFEWF